MKDRIRFRFTQLTLVCLMILSSLGSPAALNAQIPDTPDAPPKVYLPLNVIKLRIWFSQTRPFYSQTRPFYRIN